MPLEEIQGRPAVERLHHYIAGFAEGPRGHREDLGLVLDDQHHLARAGLIGGGGVVASEWVAVTTGK